MIYSSGMEPVMIALDDPIHADRAAR
jgi:hypothetical protein